MTISINKQKVFSDLLRRTGKVVELGLQSTGKVIRGKILNTMVDSIIIDHEGKSEVIAFADISFLRDI